MKLSARLAHERAFVELTLGKSAICECGATLDNFPDNCTAELADWCQGFDAIERAKQKFNQEWEEKGSK